MPARPSGSVLSLTLLAGTASVVAGTAVGTADSAPTGATRTITIGDGTVRSTVEGRGDLAAASDAAVDFKTSGRIEKVYVQEGDHVQKGQLLARLDDTSQRVALKAAKTALTSGGVSAPVAGRASTAASAFGGAPGGLSSGQSPAAVPTASPAPQGTPAPMPTGNRPAPAPSATASPTPMPSSSPAPSPTATPSPTPMPSPSATAAPYSVPTASPTPSPQPTASPAPQTTPEASATPPMLSDAMPTATPSPGTAQVMPSLGGTAPSATGAAGGLSTGSVAGASGFSTQGGAASSAAQAEAVRSARAALKATKLRAPVSGTVAQVNGKVGEATGSSSSAFATVVNTHRYAVEVSVSEGHISDIREGQPATVKIDAVAGLKLKGHVTNVGIVPNSAEGSSSVTYPVAVTIDSDIRTARAGMTAAVEIVVAQASGLVVPSQALSGLTVTVIHNGVRKTMRVSSGLEGDTSTVVTSGLSAGDQVEETSASAMAGAAATPAATTQSSTGLGGGGAAFPGGGSAPGGGFRPPGGGGFGGPPGQP